MSGLGTTHCDVPLGPDLCKPLKVMEFCSAPPSSAGLASKIPLLILLLVEGGTGSPRWLCWLRTRTRTPENPNVIRARQALGGKKCVPSSCSNAPQAGTGDEKEKTLISLSVLCSSAGDGCAARPLCPPGHPPARHQQVTQHQLKLLLRDPVNWEEWEQVWFKPQQLMQQPRVFQRCHKRVALGTPTCTALAEGQSLLGRPRQSEGAQMP